MKYIIQYDTFLILITVIVVFNKEEDIEQNTKLGNFYHINDYSYENLVSNFSSNNSWLLIFYDNQCPYSRGALINLKRDILKHYHHNKTLKFGIIDIEDKNTMKLIKRFNVKRVPYTTFITKDKMYPFTEVFTPSRIIRFIDGLNISNYKKVPKDPYKNLFHEKSISYYEQSILNFYEFIESINKPMQLFLDKYSINIKWNNKKTYLSFFIFLILLCPIEYYLIKFILYSICFRFDEQIQNNNNNQNNNEKEKKGSIPSDKNINKEKLE